MDRACAPSTAGRAEGRAVRHQSRGRLDDAGCVAPPRNSANYSSSSRLASAADPPPPLAADFGSGTLAGGRGGRSRELDQVLPRPVEGQEKQEVVAQVAREEEVPPHVLAPVLAQTPREIRSVQQLLDPVGGALDGVREDA